MKANENTCPLCTPVTKLSAWYDGDLRAAEAAHLRAHITSCPACHTIVAEYAIIAQSLLRDRLTESRKHAHQQDRLWRDLRAQILPSEKGKDMRFPKQRIWQAVATVVALIALVVGYFLVFHTHALITSVSQPTRGVTSAAKSTNLPLATQAWGSHALTKSISLAANMPFLPTAISPDGAFIVGIDPVTAQADDSVPQNKVQVLTVADGALHTLAIAAFTFNGLNQVVTDGRYIAWIDTISQSGRDIGQHVRVFDTVKAVTIPLPTVEPTATLAILAIHTGTVLWIQDAVVKLTDIATNTTQILLQLPKDAPPISATQVSWPWLAYQTQTPAQLHLLNMATRSDIVLRSPPSTLTTSALYLVGTTLFTSWTMYQKGVPGIEIDQLSQADQAGARWKTLQTLADFNGGITVVNDRLICMTGYAADSVSNTLLNVAWDRLQQRFVQMNPISRQGAFLSAPLIASKWVLYETSDNMLDLIDTSQLPTR